MEYSPTSPYVTYRLETFHAFGRSLTRIIAIPTSGAPGKKATVCWYSGVGINGVCSANSNRRLRFVRLTCRRKPERIIHTDSFFVWLNADSLMVEEVSAPHIVAAIRRICRDIDCETLVSASCVYNKVCGYISNACIDILQEDSQCDREGYLIRFPCGYRHYRI